MRMKFTISYKAEWGESLHADITFFARDGKRKVEEGLKQYAEYNILLDGNETSYHLWKTVKCQEIISQNSPIPAMKAREKPKVLPICLELRNTKTTIPRRLLLGSFPYRVQFLPACIWLGGGEPFPVYYKDGMPQMVPEECLPLELPEIETYKPTDDGSPPCSPQIPVRRLGRVARPFSTAILMS